VHLTLAKPEVLIKRSLGGSGSIEVNVFAGFSTFLPVLLFHL
jgi:hypothetical protein